MPASDLGKRVAVAAVGIPAAVAVLYAGGFWLGAVLAVVAALGALEFFRLAGLGGGRPFPLAGAGAAALMALAGAVRTSPGSAAPLLWALSLSLFLFCAAASVWTRGATSGPLVAAASTLAGAVYTGGTLTYAIFLRYLGEASGPQTAASPALVGTALVAYPIAVTWLNDTYAYFGGRRWGRRKLIPSVSPGKTVAGSVAGLVGSVVTGALLGELVFVRWLGVPVGPVMGGLGGAVLSVAAQVGDLAESLLKREAGVKDSGSLLPGHGGVLDRFDALYFTLPVGYWFLWTVLERGLGVVGP